MPAVQSRLDSHHRNVIKVTEILQNARAEAAKSRKYESAPAHRTLADQNAPDVRAVIPLLISHQILPDLRTA
ncbi:hypothetical protein B0H14DRAFT_3421600 [Mycena olivaceomarginata]|nr:hypothetical protein B0H14DRAFT_3519588 [Mycena olivaceomarginata]KAJ7724548.1 hypothetical protein B0H14DRAFT_3519589 [Mycena olivaceomarginata]KAJ7903374.1 hypothetical protein B0H14DRAFT_3421600 [Mycena olivaceomarginata]